MKNSNSTRLLAAGLLLLSIGIDPTWGFVVPRTVAVNSIHDVSMSVAAVATAEPVVKGSKKAGTTRKTNATNNAQTRKERSEQYMIRRWKSQQVAKKKKKEMNVDTPELVSALGHSGGSLIKLQKKKKNAKMGGKKGGVRASSSVQQKVQSKKKNTKKQSKGGLPFDSLSPGSTVSGKVVKILPYGALVKTNYAIPGKTYGCAMLHISQISDEKIENISEFLKVGQEIKDARVVSLNREGGKVAISLRPRTTRATPLESLNVGDEVEGKVVRLKKYGAFVDVGCKRNGLLHISRMSMYKVHNIADHVQVGQTVRVRVIQVDKDNKNIAVSMLSPENDKYLDRRDRAMERNALWQKVVNNDESGDMEETKRQLLELDRIIRDEIENRMGKPRSLEV